VRGGSHRKSIMRSSVLLLLMLWMVLAPAVPTKAQPTGYMDIAVYVSTDTPIYLPVNFTVLYMLQLVDPSSGAINILYPNRMLNISSQQPVTIGSYSVDSISNKITFWTGVNITAAGNYTYNFRLIYDSALMANNTIDTSLHIYSAFPWMYSVPITIANNLTSALTNYQIGLYLNLSAQVSAGKIRSNLGDLRFNDSSGNALSYWIEDPTTSAAKIWVKVPSIPASPSTATIYMYYGNPSATTTSSGTSTFLVFLDKDNYSGWSYTSAISLSVSGSDLKISHAASSSNQWFYLSGTYPYADGFVITAKIKHGVGVNHNLASHVTAASGTGYSIGPSGVTTAEYLVKYTPTFTTLSTYSKTSADTTNYWYLSLLAKNGGLKGKLWVAGSTEPSWETSSTDATYTSGAIGFLLYNSGSNDYVLLSFLYARNYVDPEPTYSVGSEQQLVNYAYSVSYGQLSTESQLIVQIPTFSPVQTFTANVSGSYTAPTPLPDAIKIIYNMEYGRYALALLPILFMLVAGKHYAGIMGILACGMSALINVTVGVALFDWTVLGIIAFVCILLIFTEGG